MVRKNRLTKFLSVLVCLMLITAIALTVTGCKSKNEPSTGKNVVEQQTQEVSFKLIVVDADGKEKTFDISTTEKTVGDALLKKGIIEGEEGQYGLYVKTVDGVTADYDKDGTYWAFYINGEYAMTGVSSTEIKDGETYSLKIEKG